MRIGTSLRTYYIVDDPRVGAQWLVEQTRAARDAGLDSLFVGDHHASPVAYYQNTPLLGRLLAEWDDRPWGPLFLLPLWNPVLVAEQVGTLAALSEGRCILPLAIGGDEAQFAAMGTTLGERAGRMEAGVPIVRQLLAGDDVDGARIAPVPPEPVEIWIGASAPPAVDRAARLGDGWIADAFVTPDRARQQIDEYREACARHGREPSALAIRRDVHVGKDPSDAARVAQPVIDRGYRGFDPAACTFGSAEQVTESFAQYAEMGYTDVIIRHLADDQHEVLASFERLGDVRRALVER